MSIVFDEGAKWIWLGSQTRDKNVFACFRRKFVVDGPVDHSELVITADARCDAYLNGVWLGHGPVRSWASPWPVDTYDVTPAEFAAACAGASRAEPCSAALSTTRRKFGKVLRSEWYRKWGQARLHQT